MLTGGAADLGGASPCWGGGGFTLGPRGGGGGTEWRGQQGVCHSC